MARSTDLQAIAQGDGAAAADTPDWASLAFEVLCPLCEYNLRGLDGTRCPECGYTFTWDEVLDPARRRHPYLFEHHPERNLHSFAATVLGGVSPSRFWKTLHPAQPPGRSRLVVYAVIMAMGALLPLAMGMLLGVPAGGTSLSLPTWFNKWDSLWQFLVYEYVARDVRDVLLQVSLFLIGVPLATLLTLMLFQASMQRVRLRPHHVMRCIVYSADIVLIPCLLVAALVAVNATPEYAGTLIVHIGWILVFGMPLVWLIFAWRLVQAYRRYLRFPHAVATVAAAQLIVALLAAGAGMYLDLRM